MNCHITLITHHNVIIRVLVEEVIQADVTVYVFVIIILFNIKSMCPRINGELTYLISLERGGCIDHLNILDNGADFNLNSFINFIC